jgi:hypothetical protein
LTLSESHPPRRIKISSNTIIAALTLNARSIGGVTNNDTAYWSHEVTQGENSIGVD